MYFELLKRCFKFVVFGNMKVIFILKGVWGGIFYEKVIKSFVFFYIFEICLKNKLNKYW